VKIGQLSEELSEEIHENDVPVTFLTVSFTGLPEAVNRAMSAFVILMKDTHERAVLFIQTQRHLLCGGRYNGKAAKP
jgi:hypothetical protein